MAIWSKPRRLFLVLLVLSVGTKLVLGAPAYGDHGERSTAERAVIAFLAQYGFRAGEPEGDTQLWTVAAMKGECHVRITIVSPEGWHRELIRRMASPGSKVYFVVDGRVYQDQPEWRTRAYYYWRRVNGLIRRQLPASSILGVLASPGCEWLNGLWSMLPERS